MTDLDRRSLGLGNKPALVALIASQTTGVATAEMAARLDAAGVPNAPVHAIDRLDCSLP